MEENIQNIDEILFSSKSLNTHPERSNTIPRFYSNSAISSSEKELIYRPKTLLYLFLSEISPRKRKRRRKKTKKTLDAAVADQCSGRTGG
jgi:hypothetical protein